MPDVKLDTYVGEYIREGGDYQIRIARDGNNLRLPVFGYSDIAIPTGNNYFEFLQLRASLEFTVESDDVTQLIIRYGQVTDAYVRK